MNQTKKALDRILAMALSALMLFAMLPVNSVYALAASPSKISTNLASIDFTVNEATEFTVTSVANDDAGKMVKGSFDFSDPDAITKLEYYETAEGMQGWYELTGDFGPTTGFPITDATSRFRVTFNKTGTFSVTIALKDVTTGQSYAVATETVTVKNKSGVITTDISSKEFVVNQSTEFSFTSTANDDAGRMVKGSFVFSDLDAIDTLEYYETAEGMQGWYALTGDFGPATGFPMIDGTSKFRVTFKKAGDFTVTVLMKEVGTDAEVCKVNASVSVAKADITGISISHTENKYNDNAEYDLATVNGTFLPGDKVSYTIEGDSNVYSAVPKKSAVGEYKVTITVDRGVNYNIFTQTVTSKIELGDIVLGGIKVKGLEGIYNGKAQDTVTVTGKGDYSLKYKLDDDDWSDTIPTVTDAGSYTVQVKATKTNYNDEDVPVDKAESAVYPFNVYIAKAEQTGFAFENTTPDDLAYDSSVSNTPVGGQSDGEITYTVTSGNEYVTVDSNTGMVKAIKAGGVATITATKAGNNNYNSVSASYSISTIKAAQTDFAFEKAAYSVKYGTDKLTVKAVGGQSGETVTYEIADGDVATVTSDNNAGILSFVSGKKGTVTVKATLAGGINYNDISAQSKITVATNDFSSKYTVEPVVPSTGWYTDSVTIKPAAGYKVATSGQFAANWQDSIVIAAEGKTTPEPIYLKETATGFISEAITVSDIYIDKTAPTSLKISYSKSVRDVVLETISFGFYKAEMTVTLEATDLVSKIDHLVYKIGNGEEVTIGKADITFSGDNKEIATASFKISPNLSSSIITLTAFDTAGRSATIAGDKTLVIDDIKPEISVSYDNNDAAHDMYFKADRTATISIKEENFFKDNLYDINPENGNRYLTITVGKRLNSESDYTESIVEPVFTKDGDVYKAKIKFSENADYTFAVSFFDYSGNENKAVDYGESVAPTAFTIDKIKPELSISYDDTNATESQSNAGYYQGKRVATFKVTEHNFEPSELVFTKFTANNVQGNPANEAQINAFISLLHDAANWSHNGDEHTATILFDADSNYTLELNYSDLADNDGDMVTDNFCLDNTAPNNLEVTYSASIFDTILNAITFGFYKTDATVTITANDEAAGIDYFTYSYTVDYSNDKEGHEEEVGHKNDSGKENVVISKSDITFSENGKKATASFTIPNEFRGYVSFTATDKSGNTSELFKDEKIIVVDNVAPGINVTYNNTDAQNGNYYKANRTATISISADNFFKDYLYNPIDNKEGNENYLVIKVGKKLDNQSEYSYTYEQPAFVKDGDVYKATVEFNENADYIFDIKYTDKSHNVFDSYETNEFTIDKTAPVVDVTFSEPEHSNGNQYRKDRTATIKIVEHNFDAKDVVAMVTARDPRGTVFDYAAYLKDNANWQSDGDVHTATVPFATEAHYSFDIKYTDLAGNVFDSFDAVDFTIDKTAPTAMDIKINNVSVAGSMDTFAFDKFYRTAVTVKLSANCDISGVESLKYQKVANVSDYQESGIWADYNDETGIVVSPSEKFIIYFRAEDRAGNVAIIRSTGIVVDDKQPIGETKAPEIDVIPAEPNNNGLHNKDVNVDLKVVDPKYAGSVVSGEGYYSGLNKITYTIKTTDTDAVETGVLLDVASGKTSGGVFDADNLISSWTGKITVDANKFNSNNVIVEIKAIDNAGNERVTTNNTVDEPIRIDVTKPNIDISYDNNDADSGSFFKANRTATIVITERNFKPEDVAIKITNTDGVIPNVSGWTKTAGTGNLDDTKWTATISYTADGDYTFDIVYTDLADNKMSGVVYAGGTVAQTEFTIDKTIPTIEVTYDNNSAMNGNYYKADRTATVVITEHNFNTERIDITLKATDDGKDSTLPTVSGWSTDGDKHTATITYNKDGLYTFDIAVKDKAGNDSVDFAEQTFYVDKTAPTLDITGVADRSANSGDIIPVISYSDTNYDDSQVKITLTGAIRKGVALDGSYTEQHNGKVFTFKNFAKEKSIDDIYTLTATLTDKAGNSTEKTIMFSANRFGSTYGFSAATEKLNGTYVQKAEDVVMTETNANELKNIKITLFKNNDTIILKEGEDYRIDVKGGNGQWYEYTYTVFAKNFADDGVYRLTFHSEDAAGNIAENTLDTKDKEIGFGVDKTKPNVVITNLENGKTYPLESLTVSMSVSDNLLLKSIVVYLDDYNKAYKTWNEKEIADIIAKKGEFTFDVSGDSTGAHKVKVVCTDAAGNEQVEEITDFYVTTNLFVRYYNNKALFFGSIGGVILIAGLAIALVVAKKKKKQA